MKFTDIEKQSGFSFFCRLAEANKDRKFELETEEGDILIASFDTFFDDDASSRTEEYEKPIAYHTASFIIDEVRLDKTNHYKAGHVILVNCFEMPKSYKIV